VKIGDGERADVVGERQVSAGHTVLRPFELRRTGIAPVSNGITVEVGEGNLVLNGDAEIRRAAYGAQLPRHARERQPALGVVLGNLASDEIAQKTAAHDGRTDRRQDGESDERYHDFYQRETGRARCRRGAPRHGR